MPCSCVVTGCETVFNKGVKRFRFPLNDKGRLAKWISFVNRGREWVPGKYTRICFHHFIDPVYDSVGRMLSDPTIKTVRSNHQNLKLGNAIVNINPNCKTITFQNGKITTAPPPSEPKSFKVCRANQTDNNVSSKACQTIKQCELERTIQSQAEIIMKLTSKVEKITQHNMELKSETLKLKTELCALKKPKNCAISDLSEKKGNKK